MPASGTAGALTGGEEEELIIARVPLFRVGGTQLGLLTWGGENDLASRLNIADHRGHWVHSEEATPGRGNGSPNLQLLHREVQGFSDGLGTLGQHVLGLAEGKQAGRSEGYFHGLGVLGRDVIIGLAA